MHKCPRYVFLQIHSSAIRVASRFWNRTLGNRVAARQSTAMEKEALILRARAELAKLDALRAQTEADRLVFAQQAQTYEAQARVLEETLDGWSMPGYR